MKISYREFFQSLSNARDLDRKFPLIESARILLDQWKFEDSGATKIESLGAERGLAGFDYYDLTTIASVWNEAKRNRGDLIQ